MPPRLLRSDDAAKYLGMSLTLFTEVVRPSLPVITFGRRCVAFDRHDLDAWVDDYKARNGHLGLGAMAWVQKVKRINTHPQKSKGVRSSGRVAEVIEQCLQIAQHGI
jgi:predicted DNA-binding transcriptional regulator AlpA